MNDISTINELRNPKIFSLTSKLLSLPWWVQCIGLWFSMLVLLYLVSLTAVNLAVRYDEFADGYVPIPGIPATSLTGIWLRWDSYAYMVIAQMGYLFHPNLYGYFPLYPLLIFTLSKLSGIHEALSGTIIAQLFFLGAMLGMYRLARFIRDDPNYALRSVFYFALFPTSFFFYAAYAESLYLFLAILGTIFLLRSSPGFIKAGLAYGLAGLTRPIGWLLTIPLIVKFFQERNYSIKNFMRLIIALFLSAIGIIGFVYYLYTLTGTFLAIPQAQAEWHRSYQFPGIPYLKSVWIALTGNRVPGDWFLYTINWVDLIFTTLALVITVIAIWKSTKKEYPWSLSIYLIGSLAFLLSSQGPTHQEYGDVDVIPLWGMGRWIAALFPLFLVIPMIIKRNSLTILTLIVSGSLQVLLCAWWITGRWVS
jgi:Gpi18-like mannosyltransferase